MRTSPFSQLHNGLRESLKCCLNVCFKQRLNRGRSFVLLRLWQLNVPLADGLNTFRILSVQI